MTSNPDLAPVLAAIPHRPPMLLVDAIICQDDSKIVCRKRFHADEHFVQGHFPNFPLVPGVILCECAMQAGAILLSGKSTAQDAIPVATRIDNVKFKQMVRPGDQVEIVVELKDQLSSAFYMTAKITLDGKLAARLDFACSLATNLG